MPTCSDLLTIQDPPVELLSKFSRPSYIVRFDFDKITIHKKPTELSDYFEDEAPPTDKLYPKRKAFDANGTKWIMLKKDGTYCVKHKFSNLSSQLHPLFRLVAWTLLI